MPLLQRVHESSQHKGRLPGVTQASAPPPAPRAAAPQEDLVVLRKKLDDAVRGERYEEAASLRDALRRAEQRETGSGPGEQE